ncbi:hypothetical protein KP509_06G034800 [Ceratopteris richardii]|uniref:Uncharacterized protein n=1 Tax=Ceratopteris richardii TaxID=49495 RepID=A0A8T2ULQ2_CERRI|nr:hypothetical protein KP509_06G034800 [Ceratopteris richardii]KAH7434796.1 hypothetical protein KP509_06G034800 [Ceratopteris richardii]
MKLSRLFRKTFLRSRARKKSSGRLPTEVNGKGVRVADLGNLTNSKDCDKNGAEVHPDAIDWELRPGGMLVQRRDVVVKATPSLGPLIKLKISHGVSQHDITIPSHATFGDLKWLLAQEVGLQPRDQRLIFQGKEKDDNELLHISGVKDMGKVILVEDPASKEKKLKELRSNQGVKYACQAVAQVRAWVDKLCTQISALDEVVNSGVKVAGHEFNVLTELLMQQLLELDTIQAEGEAKVERKVEVRRVQGFTEHLDNLKLRCGNPICNNASLQLNNRGTADLGMGTQTQPLSPMKVTTNWETF